MKGPPDASSGPRRDEAAWTGPEEIRATLRKDWDSGRLPAALLRSAPDAPAEGAGIDDDRGIEGGAGEEGARGFDFPLRLRLRGPSSTQLGERFQESRSWVAALRQAEDEPGYRLEWRTVEHRQLGRNEVPVAAVFATPADAVAFIGKKREAARLLELVRKIEAAFPSLRPWLLRRPLETLDRHAEWPTILGTLAWFRGHPRSGRYARQIDAPGVHSKFVESRRGLLAELLDLILDPDAIDASATGAAAFSRRYGLVDKPALVRFRSLDGELPLGAAGLAPVSELSLRAGDFARLYDAADAPFAEIFVTENEVNFLAFPRRRGAAMVLGAGYGFSQLASAAWLRGGRLRYWGDLDTHGFAILDQFRSTFPEAESFLMDRATLLVHRELWTEEPKPAKADLRRLTPDEAALYRDLRVDKYRHALRLEQERIGYSWLETALGESP